MSRSIACPALLLVFSCMAASLLQTEAKSIFAIGTRILDDQLLMKDVLQAKPLSTSETPAVVFNYAIPEPITYIEIFSEANVLAEVNFGYYNDLVGGTIKAIKETIPAENEEHELITRPFEVQISIYGFNETVLNLSPAFLLNRNTQYNGIMEIPEEDTEEIENEHYVSGDEQYETFRKFDDLTPGNYSYTEEGEEVQESESVGEEEEEEEDETQEEFTANDEDKIIEIGKRQPNDHLLYETFQTSPEASSLPCDHTAIFYYIDSDFITFVQFVIYGHYSGKSIASSEYKPPVAEYSHFSPNSLKATITDFNTTSLVVHMFVFGYSPAEVSMDYVPFLRSSSTQQKIGAQYNEMTLPTSPMERLKLLMKSKWTNANAEASANENDVNEEQAVSNNRISITDTDEVVAQKPCIIQYSAPSASAATSSSFTLHTAVVKLMLLLLGLSEVIRQT